MTTARAKVRSQEPRKPPDDAKLLEVCEAAYILRVCVTTVYQEIKGGRLARLKVGRRTMITRDDLDDYLRKTKRVRVGGKPGPETKGKSRLLRDGLIDDVDDLAPGRRRGS